MSQPTLAGALPGFPRASDSAGMISGTIEWADRMTKTLRMLNRFLEAMVSAAGEAESSVGTEGGA